MVGRQGFGLGIVLEDGEESQPSPWEAEPEMEDALEVELDQDMLGQIQSFQVHDMSDLNETVLVKG